MGKFCLAGGKHEVQHVRSCIAGGGPTQPARTYSEPLFDRWIRTDPSTRCRRECTQLDFVVWTITPERLCRGGLGVFTSALWVLQDKNKETGVIFHEASKPCSGEGKFFSILCYLPSLTPSPSLPFFFSPSPSLPFFFFSSVL